MIPLVDDRRVCPRANPPAAVSGERRAGPARRAPSARAWNTLEPSKIADNRLTINPLAKSI
jgi:hypothetical protein